VGKSGVAVAVGVAVDVGLGVKVAVGVAVAVAVAVAVGLGLAVSVGAGVRVAVAEGGGVGVSAAVGVPRTEIPASTPAWLPGNEPAPMLAGCRCMALRKRTSSGITRTSHRAFGTCCKFILTVRSAQPVRYRNCRKLSNVLSNGSCLPLRDEWGIMALRKIRAGASPYAAKGNCMGCPLLNGGEPCPC
jgi:hypothetical protein